MFVDLPTLTLQSQVVEHLHPQYLTEIPLAMQGLHHLKSSQPIRQMGRQSQQAQLVGSIHTRVYYVNHDRWRYPTCHK